MKLGLLFVSLLLYMGVAPAMTFKIVSVENPAYTKELTTPAQKVSFPLSKEDKEVLAFMKKKVVVLGGVGLAAPQINVHQSMAVIYIPKEAALLREHVIEYPLIVLINPSYEVLPDAKVFYDYESCYSVESKAGKVPRYDAIRVSYEDEQGMHHVIEARNFYARVMQHEIDHLQGILLTHRLTKDCVQGTPDEMFALRRSELTPEKRAEFDRIIGIKRSK